MEDLICMDSSVLINHFREKIKTNTFFFNLSFKYPGFAIQPFVHFEIYVGALPNQKLFWDTALKYKYALATINERHFEHIDGLKLITPYNL